MGSATCSFSERVNVLNGVASVVLKYAMHLAGALSQFRRKCVRKFLNVLK